MKVTLKKITPAKVLGHLNPQKTKPYKNTCSMLKPNSDCNSALATLERNALDMPAEDYIRARTYLASLDYRHVK